MNVLPKSLAGQLLLLLLGGIFVAHALGIIIFYLDSPNAIQLAARNQVVDRVASAIRVSEAAKSEDVRIILKAMSSRQERFWIEADDGTPLPPMTRRETQLATDL